MKPGPRAHPARTLADAAILYAADLEVCGKITKRGWDRLAKAALRYRADPKPLGRPRKPLTENTP